MISWFIIILLPIYHALVLRDIERQTTLLIRDISVVQCKCFQHVYTACPKYWFWVFHLLPPTPFRYIVFRQRWQSSCFRPSPTTNYNENEDIWLTSPSLLSFTDYFGLWGLGSNFRPLSIEYTKWKGQIENEEFVEKFMCIMDKYGAHVYLTIASWLFSFTWG